MEEPTKFSHSPVRPSIDTDWTLEKTAIALSSSSKERRLISLLIAATQSIEGAVRRQKAQNSSRPEADLSCCKTFSIKLSASSSRIKRPS